MTITRLVRTTRGPVEITRTQGTRPAVLFFPGGHCRSATDCGQDIYTALGHEVVSFSRPGYGRTDVGPMDVAEFADIVREVCEELGTLTPSAAVGVSFGGLQAIHVAAHPSTGVERLVLHSAAPSTLPYPDTWAEAHLGPVAFSPGLQPATWWLIRRAVAFEPGLRAMLARLSTLPPHEWWDSLPADDKDRARAVFRAMSSGSGFVNDLRQARTEQTGSRREALARVACPTLITASPHDGGVDLGHARDLHARIERSVLVEVPSATHLFWIGAARSLVVDTVEGFLQG